MRRWAAPLFFLALVLGLWVAACNVGQDFETGSLGKATNSAPEGGLPPEPSSTTCTADAGAPLERIADPSTLPECGPACAGAHCVPADKVPADANKVFSTCSGGYCIPDTFIESGGLKPPSCASLGGSAGVCLSVCVPQVADNADSLPQATCASGELCAPCVNPMDNTYTGACEIGVSPPGACGADAGTAPAPVQEGDGAPPPPQCPHVGPPVIDPSTLPACGGANSGAHCLPAKDVPESMVSELATCPTGYCVPDKLIASGGQFIPATCTSIAGAEGRCENTVLPAVAAQANFPTATCDADERCVPCFNPLDGTNTGACNTSCDPGPTQPAVVLAPCCMENGTAQGKCVPASLVPASMQSFLSTASCTGGDLCAPDENLQSTFVPKTCEYDVVGFTVYTGVCLSNCLKLPDASDLDQGSCNGIHTCVPCVDPTSGSPTGAPGC